MKDDSSEEDKPNPRARGRKRCTRIDNSDSEEKNEKLTKKNVDESKIKSRSNKKTASSNK